MSATLGLLKELIARRSLTPDDAGCQQLIAQSLTPLGFKIEHLRFGDVDNLWARRGALAPLFVFAGHTDVVPTGPLDQWKSDPFTPTLRDGYLYGR
ncbi:MAG: M20/M25/M40 family metallo-hydrolase, partial [Gammaproteobacteria bacterium]